MGSALPPYLSKQDWSQRNFTALVMCSIAFPILLISILYSVNSIKKPTSSNNKDDKKTQLNFFSSLQYVFKNNVLFTTCLTIALMNLALSYIGTSAALFNKYVLRISNQPVSIFGNVLTGETQSTILQSGSVISSLMFIPFYLKLINKYGVNTMWRVETTFFSAVCLLNLFVTEFIGGFIIVVLVGIAISGLFVLPEILLAEAIELDNKKTGVKKSGLVYGFNALLIHISAVFIEFGKAFILNNTNYLQPTPEVPLPIQPDLAIFGIRTLVSIVPAAIMMLSNVILYKRNSSVSHLKNE